MYSVVHLYLSFKIQPVYVRRVDPSALAFSLSLHRHIYEYSLYLSICLFKINNFNATLENKVTYQDFFWVLIDLNMELLGLIIKTFDNQTTIWS